MARLMDDLGAYLKEVIGEGKERVLLLFDLLGIILFFFPQLAEYVFRNEWLARRIGAVIFVLSFSWANFILYRKLKGRIDEYEDTRANIRLRNIKDLCYAASINSPYFPRKGKTFHQTSDHLHKNGLPIGLVIAAELRLAKQSSEYGGFDWQITKVDMPEFFSLLEIGKDSFRWGRDGAPLVEVTRSIDGAMAICELPVKITVEDPRSFAESLSSLGSYRIVIKYCTIRIDDSKSKTYSLKLEGDFQGFRDKICRSWINCGLGKLAQLAECDKEPPQPQGGLAAAASSSLWGWSQMVHRLGIAAPWSTYSTGFRALEILTVF